MTERELLEALAQALELARWTWMHIIRSDGVTQGDRGWPDLFAVKESRGLALAWELKSDIGQLTTEQLGWQLELRAVPGVDVRTIRPADYDRALAVIIGGRSPREVFDHGGTDDRP